MGDELLEMLKIVEMGHRLIRELLVERSVLLLESLNLSLGLSQRLS